MLGNYLQQMILSDAIIVGALRVKFIVDLTRTKKCLNIMSPLSTLEYVLMEN